MRRLFYIVLIGLSTCYINISFGQTFTNANNEAGIDHFMSAFIKMGGGTAFFDYNNDGFQDIFLCGGANSDKLYQNNGDGTFTDVSFQAGLFVTDLYKTQGVVTGDIDNDGYRDVFLTVHSKYDSFFLNTPLPNILLHNNGNGTFTDISQSAGFLADSAWSISATFGDYNQDGYLDLYVGNYVDTVGVIQDSSGNPIGFSHLGFENDFYINNGNLTFTNIAANKNLNSTGNVLANAFTDYDQDRDVDIYIANDFGEFHIPNELFRNEYPVDSFTDVSDTTDADIALYGMGIAIGDYDEDGDFDYYVTNLGRNVLLRHDSTKFVDVTTVAGVENTYVDTLFTTGWGTQFFDYDNDTYLDLFVCNGHIPAADFIATSEKDPNKLFKNNNANGTFTDVSVAEGVSDSLIGRGSAFCDYDNDGDLDLMTVILYQDSVAPVNIRSKLYKNNSSTTNNWVSFNLQGTISNRDAYGTHVELYTNGRKFIRELGGGSSHASQNSSVVHFGLGNYTGIDSVVIKWTNGLDETYYNLDAGTHYYYIEGGPESYVYIYSMDTICTTNPVTGTTIVHDTILGGIYDTIYITTYTQEEGILAGTNNVSICDGDSILIYGIYQTTSGVYYDTSLLASTCENFKTVLKVLVNPFFNLGNEHICSGDTLQFNGKNYYQSGTYFDTLSSHFGCDSVLSFTLEVHEPSFDTLSVLNICDGESIDIFGQSRNTPGYYLYTDTSQYGCDSILVQQLIVLPIFTSTDSTSICEGDSIYLQGGYQMWPGIYYNFLTATNGCDSTVEVTLFVLPHSATIQSITICEGESVFLEGEEQTTSGDYYDTLNAFNGCDSLVTTTLTVKPAGNTDRFFTILDGDSIYVGGDWQTESGIYTDTFIIANGCDSIVTTTLTIFISVGEIDNNINWAVYPNPAQQSIWVEIEIADLNDTGLKLYSADGKLISTHLLLNNKTEIAINHLATGIYYVEISSADKVSYKKLVVVEF